MSQIRVDDLISENALKGVNFTQGINVTGVATASGGFAGALTGNATGLTGTPDITVDLVTANDVQVGGALTVVGNLTVDGTQTIVNTDTLDVADTTVGIASTTTASNTTANGAGIEIYASSSSLSNNKTLKWSSTGYNWTFAKGGLVVDSGGLNVTGVITASSTFDGRAPNVEMNSTSSGAYTLVAADAGKVVSVDNTCNIPNSIFTAGDVVTVYNSSSGNITLDENSGVTLRQAGTANTGDRTLAGYSLVTIYFLTTSACVVTGATIS